MLQSKMDIVQGADLKGSEPVNLRFDAVAAVRGIAFHLVDEKLGREVSPEAMETTIKRLSIKGVFYTIARERWMTMTNPQRLDWLLAETHTLTLIGADDVIYLRARRSR